MISGIKLHFISTYYMTTSLLIMFHNTRLPFFPSFPFRFAFLQFGSKEEVQEIIKTKQGVELAGKKLVLSQFSSRSSGDAKSPGRAQRVPKTKGNSLCSITRCYRYIR